MSLVSSKTALLSAYWWGARLPKYLLSGIDTDTLFDYIPVHCDKKVQSDGCTSYKIIDFLSLLMSSLFFISDLFNANKPYLDKHSTCNWNINSVHLLINRYQPVLHIWHLICCLLIVRAMMEKRYHVSRNELGTQIKYDTETLEWKMTDESKSTGI